MPVHKLVQGLTGGKLCSCWPVQSPSALQVGTWGNLPGLCCSQEGSSSQSNLEGRGSAADKLRWPEWPGE